MWLGLAEAVAGLMIADANLRMAAALFLGFRCFLRTSEIWRRVKEDFELLFDNSAIGINLGWTKTAKRHGAPEKIVFEDGRLLLLPGLALERLRSVQRCSRVVSWRCGA
eukprot:8682254-Lingulodinium_polyedra.AAC.1